MKVTKDAMIDIGADLNLRMAPGTKQGKFKRTYASLARTVLSMLRFAKPNKQSLSQLPQQQLPTVSVYGLMAIKTLTKQSNRSVEQHQ